MSFKGYLIALILLALIAWGVIVQRDPYHAKLPFGTTDLTSIQATLDRLPPEDRDLVNGYVRRSNGDVLPPSMADPDDPLTARTVAEAIELQKRFMVKQAELEAKMQAIRAKRDQARAPLRAALAMELVSRAIIPRGQWLGQPASRTMNGKTVMLPIDDTPVQVTTYRLNNTSDRAITEIKASVDIYKAPHKVLDFTIDGCWITRQEPLPPGASLEVRCGNTQKTAGPLERGYVDMPLNALEIVWNPVLIRFADGKELAFKED
ncbi:MAG: hypothetical protein U1F68_06500 [Gammaproteobacteria bacterium]